jgi:hypothetical protein
MFFVVFQKPDLKASPCFPNIIDQVTVALRHGPEVDATFPPRLYIKDRRRIRRTRP